MFHLFEPHIIVPPPMPEHEQCLSLEELEELYQRAAKAIEIAKSCECVLLADTLKPFIAELGDRTVPPFSEVRRLEEKYFGVSGNFWRRAYGCPAIGEVLCQDEFPFRVSGTGLTVKDHGLLTMNLADSNGDNYGDDYDCDSNYYDEDDNNVEDTAIALAKAEAIDFFTSRLEDYVETHKLYENVNKTISNWELCVGEKCKGETRSNILNSYVESINPSVTFYVAKMFDTLYLGFCEGTHMRSEFDFPPLGDILRCKDKDSEDESGSTSDNRSRETAYYVEKHGLITMKLTKVSLTKIELDGSSSFELMMREPTVNELDL